MKIREVTEGLPRVVDPLFHRLLNRGHHVSNIRMQPRGRFQSEDRYDVELAPNGGTPYVYRRAWEPGEHPKVAHHDPNVSDLYTYDKDEPYAEHTVAKPKPGLLTQIPSLGPGYMYRGGSSEEFQNFMQTGVVSSSGEYNIGKDQRGLTYWTTEPSSANSYANGFAPVGFKPTFEHPAYIWVAPMVPPEEIRNVKGTGAHEIGVIRPISAAEIVQIWEGRVYDYGHTSFTLVPHEYGDNPAYKIGSAGYGSTQVYWKRIV